MDKDFSLNANFTEMDPSTFSSLYKKAAGQSPVEILQMLTASSMYLTDNSINFSCINGVISITRAGEPGEITLSPQAYRGFFLFHLYY